MGNGGFVALYKCNRVLSSMNKITDSDLITEQKADFVLSEAKEQLAPLL